MSVPFGSGRAVPKAPDKGSFPLDHDGACRKPLVAYLKCLRDNQAVTINCRNEIKSYLQCRMDNGLMAPEEWKKLGFSEDSDTENIDRHLREEGGKVKQDNGSGEQSTNGQSVKKDSTRD